MMVIGWDSQRKATSEGVRGPVPESGEVGLAIVYGGVIPIPWGRREPC